MGADRIFDEKPACLRIGAVLSRGSERGGIRHDYFRHFSECVREDRRALMFLEVRRIGEAQNPGPGA